jgi:cytochrome P450
MGFVEASPMALDRTAGWNYFKEHGDVFESDGSWYLTSLEAVRYAHRHPELFSSARAFDTLGSPVPLVPIATDPPDHARFRRALDPLVAPRVIRGLEDELRCQVGEIIDAFVGRGSCEIVEELAKPYPTQVILTMFGLPLEDRDRFFAWVDVIINSAADGSFGDPTPEQVYAGLALFTYMQEFIDAKRKNPGHDMISSILCLTGDAEWTNEEVLGLCFLVTLAGLDTVTASIGFILMHLARRPDLRRRIVESPELTIALIEEILRLEAPAALTPRVTTEDVEVAGKTIPAGSSVFLALGAANRSEEWGATPDEIDLDHAGRGHLTFGGGIHRCMGSHLARRELCIAIEEFHRRIPNYSLPEGFEPRLVWPSGTFHLSELPLVFSAGDER